MKNVNLFEDAQRRESWEYFPFELRLHAVDAIQFLRMIVLRIPFDFILPSCAWIISHLSLSHKALSRRRCKLKHWSSDKLFRNCFQTNDLWCCGTTDF